MMLPVIPFKKIYHSKQTVQRLFGDNKTEDLYFNAVYFEKLNLCTETITQNPLVIEFRNHTNSLQQIPAGIGSTTIVAVFTETTNLTKIDVTLKTNPYLFWIYGLLFIAFVYLSFAGTPNYFLIGLVLTAGIYDLYSKYDFLKRFKRFLGNVHS